MESKRQGVGKKSRSDPRRAAMKQPKPEGQDEKLAKQDRPERDEAPAGRKRDQVSQVKKLEGPGWREVELRLRMRRRTTSG